MVQDLRHTFICNSGAMTCSRAALQTFQAAKLLARSIQRPALWAFLGDASKGIDIYWAVAEAKKVEGTKTEFEIVWNKYK